MPTPLDFRPLSKTVRILRMDRQVGTIRYDSAKVGWIATMDNGNKSQAYSTWPEAATETEYIENG